MDRLGRKIQRIAHKIKRQIDYKNQSIGISATQARIIGFIRNESLNKDIFQKDLEEYLELRGSSVTSTLKNLEKQGFIERIPLANDQRLKKLVLTKKAITLDDQLFENINLIEEESFLNLTQDEIIELSRLLDIVLKNVENY